MALSEARTLAAAAAASYGAAAANNPMFAPRASRKLLKIGDEAVPIGAPFDREVSFKRELLQ